MVMGTAKPRIHPPDSRVHCGFPSLVPLPSLLPAVRCLPLTLCVPRANQGNWVCTVQHSTKLRCELKMRSHGL
ncbi:hypothetical protein BO82DRAFT_11684 [Aspergillus uvarum CBS 121591]|uniref:Uncharacterized protein n=1 Tax=Aspergillus uvarum CBS 121591 TaxID=1448315 RepID=A0A319BUG7_9EURO|nr:hypothetical protein BO82DRAFT_11684 [Aspergillus uvarum CBS 121591]PYH75867.1 hypothetical protein BO82DRAFT_11684 [Aspergillus uvarum CBS 121591]